MESLQEHDQALNDEPLDPELEAQIDAAYEAARNAPPLPAARKAEFLSGSRLLLLHLKNGQRLAIPVEELEELEGIPEEKLHCIELLGPGTWLHFPDFDGNLDVPFLAEGGRGGPKWMEQLEASRAAALKAA